MKVVSLSRVFSEILNHYWANAHKNYIQSSEITGDTIKTNSKTQPFPDKIDTIVIKVIYGDIKSGNEMVKWPLKGTLGEVLILKVSNLHILIMRSMLMHSIGHETKVYFIEIHLVFNGRTRRIPFCTAKISY